MHQQAMKKASLTHGVTLSHDYKYNLGPHKHHIILIFCHKEEGIDKKRWAVYLVVDVALSTFNVILLFCSSLI